MTERYAGRKMADYLSQFGMDGMTNTENHSTAQMNQTTKKMDGAYLGESKQKFEDVGGDLTNVGNNNSGHIDINNGIEKANFFDNKRYYGGDSRSFTYNGGGGTDALYDSPASMATMAGFYDVNDSPGATSKFLDKYMNENRIYQQQNDQYHQATGDFDYGSDKSRAIDYGAYHDRVFNTHGPVANYLNSDYESGRLFGDMDSWLNNPPEWKMPKPPRPPKDEEDLKAVIDEDNDDDD